MWILLSEHNEYNQFGSYFVAAWNHKPTSDELKALNLFSDEDIENLLSNKLTSDRDHWYSLDEVQEGVAYPSRYH